MTARRNRRPARHLLVVLTVAVTGTAGLTPSLQSQTASATTPIAPLRDAAAGASNPATGTIATGTLRGRIIDAAQGHPLRGVRIQVTSGSAPDVFTDDDGRFTIPALPAGRHSLVASKAGYVSAWRRDAGPSDAYQRIGPPVTLAAGQVEQVDMALSKGGIVTGRVIDQRGREVIGARVYLARAQWRDGRQQMTAAAGVGDQTNDLGEFRLFAIPAGTYLLGVRIPTQAGEGLLEVYAPGTFGPDGAEPIAVRAGEERAIAITLPATPAAAVRGTVRGADGQADVRAVVQARLAGTSASVQMQTYARADGSYRLSTLAPGEYEISAYSSSTRTFASARVRVDGSDLTLPLTLSEGATIAGRYRFDTGAPPPGAKPPSSVGAGVLPVSLPYNDARRMTIGEDWRFTITGLAGSYRITPYQPTGWFVKRITRDGRDITHEPVEVATGTIDGIEVLLTQKTTQLSVTVEGTDTELEETTVLIFGEDESKHWLSSPFIRTIRTAQQRSGQALQWHNRRSFTLSGLPPARYAAVALSQFEFGQETNPSLLRRVAKVASTIELDEEGARAIALKVMPVP